ncbi:MAG: tetratricopeptide repeat protein [Pseudohongiellaceae bacterium]
MLFPVFTRADQHDPALDPLFSVLQQTDNPQVLAEAENRIWQVWLSHPNADVMQLMVTATQLMNNFRYTDALALYSGIIRGFPDYAEAWNKRATLYYLAGNFDASIADIRQTLVLEPRHFGALSGLGLIYLQQNELRSARQAFEDVLKVHPNSANAIENLVLINQTLRKNII